MTRWLVLPLVLSSTFLISANTSAQDLAPVDARSARVTAAPAGGILTPPSTAAHGAIVADFLQTRGIDATTAASLRATGEQVAPGSGLSHLTMVQDAGGLQVYGTYVKATFSANGELLHLIENLARVSPAGVVGTQVAAAQALTAALRELYPGQSFAVTEAGRDGNTTTFSAGPFFYRNPSVTAMALPMTDNVLRSGYLVETWSGAANELNYTVVGGDGRVLSVESRTNNDKYRVFLIDPLKSAQTDENGPGASNAESPIGWLVGDQLSTNIHGNNVRAYLDTNNNNSADPGGTIVTGGEFLTTADLTSSPGTTDNQNVAVQNLFFLNNVIHDILYKHGFNEAAGNFQASNFGKGGNENDPVNAEAQDGGGVDNANFSTPSDGSSPRMQMYLWTGLGDHLVIVGGDTYLAAGASFGPALTTTGVTGDLALVNDGSGDVTDACESIPGGQLTNKIALVDRGSCNFTVKVRNAQSAGAIAVIVANNVAGSFFTMGGTDRRVRIPSVMVSYDDGQTLRASKLGLSTTTKMNPVQPLDLDGTLDSDIVYHEYCHGLTWRMIGGMTGKLPGAIGEGMSDVCALLINGDDRVGEYAASDPLGIRRFPYMNYPNTYGDVTGAEVHDDGEIYGAIGWRLRENFAGSVDTLFGYIVDGMNYTPSGPYFEDMRDGILQAISDPGDKCKVWEAFARYGVGVGAHATVTKRRGGTVTIVESFTVPVDCQ